MTSGDTRAGPRRPPTAPVTAAKASAKPMAPSSGLLVSTPTDRSEACPVRTAKAVPTWQATMPGQLTVVACRYASRKGLPAPVAAEGERGQGVGAQVDGEDLHDGDRERD